MGISPSNSSPFKALDGLSNGVAADKDTSLQPTPEETLLQELLKAAQETKALDGLSLQTRIEKILDLRIKNEVRILRIIDDGLLRVVDGEVVITDKALALHKSHKDSLSELVKAYRLLSDLSTENINVYTLEERAELDLLRGGIYGRG